MEGRKYSRQREAILTFLSGRTDHPTADVIYENVRKVEPKVSLGTIYRNLSLLTELGQIQKIGTGDGKEHYDWNAAPHNHFVCRQCGALLDLHVKSPCTLMKKAVEAFDGEIEGCAVQFFGTCPECMKKRKSRAS